MYPSLDNTRTVQINAPVDIDILLREIYADGILAERRQSPDEVEAFFRKHINYIRTQKKYTHFTLSENSPLHRWQGHLSVWWAAVMSRDLANSTLKGFFQFLSSYAEKRWLPTIKDGSLNGVAHVDGPYNVNITLPQLLFWNYARYQRPTSIVDALNTACPDWGKDLQQLWRGGDPALYRDRPFGLSFVALGVYHAGDRLSMIERELEYVTNISLPLARKLFIETLQFRGYLNRIPANIRRCVIDAGVRLNTLCQTTMAKPQIYGTTEMILQKCDEPIAVDWLAVLHDANNSPSPHLKPAPQKRNTAMPSL